MAKKKPVAVSADHPALAPKLAWKELVQHLMAKHGIKHQYDFGSRPDVTAQTMSRWLGDHPPMPQPSSFEQVAAAFQMPESQLLSMWLSFMRRHDAYPLGPAADSEIAEPSPGYDAQDLSGQAEALKNLDLNAAPLDMRPFLHRMRSHISDSASHLADGARQIKAQIECFRQLFQGAVDTARKMSRGTGH